MIRRLLGLFRRPPPPLAPAAREEVMHLADRMSRAVCGAQWSPADPVTVEAKWVTCPRCKRISHRIQIDRYTKIR